MGDFSICTQGKDRREFKGTLEQYFSDIKSPWSAKHCCHLFTYYKMGLKQLEAIQRFCLTTSGRHCRGKRVVDKMVIVCSFPASFLVNFTVAGNKVSKQLQSISRTPSSLLGIFQMPGISDANGRLLESVVIPLYCLLSHFKGQKGSNGGKAHFHYCTITTWCVDCNTSVTPVFAEVNL